MKKKYHHGELRQAVLKAVGELVRTKGAEAVTIRECARLAGVSHAAPLHHFRDHHGMLAAYVGEQWIKVADLMEAHRAAAGRDPFDQLNAVGMAYMECGMGTPGLFALLLRPDLCPTPGSEYYERGAQRAHDHLIDAIKACTGGSAQDASLAELAWSAVHGFVELQLLEKTTEWKEKAQAMQETMRPIFTSCSAQDPRH